MNLYPEIKLLLTKSRCLINAWTIVMIILVVSFFVLSNAHRAMTEHIERLNEQIKTLEQTIQENEQKIQELEEFYRRAASVRDYAIALRVPEDRATEIAVEIVRLSDRYGVDYRLVTAVAAHESGFRCVRGSVDEWGILQVRPATYRWMMGTSRGFWDWRQNLEAGVKFLAYLQERFGEDTEAILAAYNAGPNQPREKMLRKTVWYRVRVQKNLKKLGTVA